MHLWKCSPDAANFSMATATNTPLMQSCERACCWAAAGLPLGCCCRCRCCCLAEPTASTRMPHPPARRRRRRPTLPSAPRPAHALSLSLTAAEWRKKYGDDVSIFKWCRAGLSEEVPQLQPVLSLVSRKARPERGLTVVTQLSLERFQMLGNQCSNWPFQVRVC